MRTRNILSANTTIELHEKDNPAYAKILSINTCLGYGSSTIAYDTVDNHGIHYVLKECLPIDAAERNKENRCVIWNNNSKKQKAIDKFENAYQIQLQIQSIESTENSTVKLTGGLFEGYNTEYTLSVHNNARTFDDAVFQKDSLFDIVSTLKSVAKVLKGYHDSGYLHLDIKPKNIMVIPETRDLVLLLDFDSVILKNSTTWENLSYSPEFAAPEQKIGRISNICEATDYYAIGAILLYKIFHRTPTAMDSTTYASWDYDGIQLFDGINPKSKILVTDILRKTLNATVNGRYASDNQLIDALDVLAKCCSKQSRYLLSSHYSSNCNIVGRENELLEISRGFEQKNIVILHGVGGIGKTELARKYAEKNSSNFEAICIGKYRDSLASLFADNSFIFIANNNEIIPTTKNIRPFVSNRTLLIIDSFDTANDPDISDLFALADLGCKILITTKCDLIHIIGSNFCQIEIGALSDDAAQNLLLSEIGSENDSANINVINKILSDTEKNTLLIILIGRLIARDHVHTIEEIAASIYSSKNKIHIEKDGHQYDTIENMLCAVFDMSFLTSAQKYVLESISVISGYEIEAKNFLNWIGEVYNDDLNDLIDWNFIEIDHDMLTVHDYIAHVCILKSKVQVLSLPWVRHKLQEYVDYARQLNMQPEIYISSYDDAPAGLADINGRPLALNHIDNFNYARLISRELMIESCFNSCDLSNPDDIETIVKFYSSICNLETGMFKSKGACLRNFINYLPLTMLTSTLRRIESSSVYDELGSDLKFEILIMQLYPKIALLFDPHTREITNLIEQATKNPYNIPVSLDNQKTPQLIAAGTDEILDFSCKIEEFIETSFISDDREYFYRCLLEPLNTATDVFGIALFSCSLDYLRNYNEYDRLSALKYANHIVSLIDKAYSGDSQEKRKQLKDNFLNSMTVEAIDRANDIYIGYSSEESAESEEASSTCKEAPGQWYQYLYDKGEIELKHLFWEELSLDKVNSLGNIAFFLKYREAYYYYDKEECKRMVLSVKDPNNQKRILKTINQLWMRCHVNNEELFSEDEFLKCLIYAVQGKESLLQESYTEVLRNRDIETSGEATESNIINRCTEDFGLFEFYGVNPNCITILKKTALLYYTGIFDDTFPKTKESELRSRYSCAESLKKIAEDVNIHKYVEKYDSVIREIKNLGYNIKNNIL